MLTVLHNPRCRKSREALNLLDNANKKYRIVKYLEDVPTEDELKKIINKLDITPIELVRKNEAVWKEKFKNQDLSADQLIKIMVQNPKLIERPIVMNENKAVIGRPPSVVLSID